MESFPIGSTQVCLSAFFLVCHVQCHKRARTQGTVESTMEASDSITVVPLYIFDFSLSFKRNAD